MRIRHRVFAAARFAPVTAGLLLAAALLADQAGCGNGIYPKVTSSGSATPTATSSPGSGSFAYASNFKDGKVSEFKRSPTSGTLTWIGQVTAGKTSGPMGLAVAPGDNALYVANQADNNVYQFAIASNGTLSTIGSGSVAAGSQPQMIAIDSSGSWAYVTNFGDGSISQYAIDSTNGALSPLSTKFTGLSGPFGIIAHPTGQFIYVADNKAGTIWTFSIKSDGTLSQLGAPVLSFGSTAGSPGLMAIASDSTGTYLLVDDVPTGIVSEFIIQPNGTLAFVTYVFGGGSGNTIGIGFATNTSVNYLFTANSTANTVAYFSWGGGVLTLLNALVVGGGPTGLVTDPQGNFVYTGNSASGTISQLRINGGCGQALCPVATVASEKPANATAGTQYVVMTH
jgi:6-phosphogluconolactonase (cycloisomerase 2 family)